MLFKDGQMSFSLGPPSGRPLEQHNPRNQVRMDSFECLEILIKKRERERNLNIKGLCRGSVFKEMVVGKGIQ